MYKVGTSQVTNTNKAKSVLSSTRLSASSSVRRPSNKNSSLKNSVISNTKNSSKKVEVSDRANKKSDVASKNVALNKIVTNDEIKNALIATNVLCVTYAKNVLIPCHDNYLAKYKLNVHSNVRRALFTIPRTVKSTFKYTTPVVSKTRFSVRTVQFKSLDTTPVVSKAKIVTDTPLSAKNKIVDSGCSKHMTGDRSLLKNFVKKFMGTVRFGNDHFAAITGYGDYVQGNITICHVYYGKGLGYNLFSVGQFYDGHLEVAFRSKTCYVRNMEGDDLLTGDCESNLYIILIPDMASSSLVCLMSKASLTKSWGKIKKASHTPKLVPSSHSKLELLHMDLCSPMRVASINGKNYILVIVDDYSRFTWVYFLRSEDETHVIIKNFITQVQLNFDAKIHKIRTNNGIEFKIATLKTHYEKLGIMQQFSIARRPQQNVSTATTKVKTSSTEISTATFSDATVYAFLSTQPQGSQLVHEDLEQLHDDDLEEMDLKWNMALLSMRARKSVGHKEYQMGLLRDELEKVKQEKEGFEFKIAKFDKSAKDLEQLLVSLEEFKEPEVNEYGPRNSSLKPTIGCDKESKNCKENTDDSLEQHQKTDTETSSVKEVEPKKVRENNDASIIEDWVSDDEDDDESYTPKGLKEKLLYLLLLRKSLLNLKNKLKGQLGGELLNGELLNGKLLNGELLNGELLNRIARNGESGNDSHADDADIRPVSDEEPMAEVAFDLLRDALSVIFGLSELKNKGFAIAALKNELRKLTGNSVNTKFAKPSILGKPVGQPLKNQSVVRQPTAFKSEGLEFQKPRFASQVDVNFDLSKPSLYTSFAKGGDSALQNLFT
ncbi:retrovirus-related pol polyprotein from transposon TNT 1-94 [Tanacetum coccineum]